ncbi:delta-sarcoglycan [Episyrphus balteatus]|uniref:delta-sarcoglycan n=1 Tax=Episyrphus balteatus TaxID=286459 RepID=UPI002485F916|nr:delta-sarcoglycan [Episyrphus balteatus]XP_055846980.1 delta-sarcoglycan [Episyrphus balteatus]
MNTKTLSPTSSFSNNNNINNINHNNSRSLKAQIFSKSPNFVRKSLCEDNGSTCNIIGNTGACSGGGSFSEAGDIAEILRNADDAAMIGDTGTTRSERLPRQSAYVAGVDLGDRQHTQQATTSRAFTENHQQRLQQPQKKLPNMGASGRGHRIGASSFADGIDYHLGLMGWRKKCLYTLILVLMLLIIINLVLTLWILKVMEFSSEGMGQLKIVPGGIQLTGQAFIMDLLRASTIRSKHGQPISIESSRNFSINTRDTNGILENHLFLGHDKLECLSTGFQINDTTGRNLFSVTRDEVSIGAHALRIDGEGGAIFRESIQTPHVRAEAGRELRFESPTRQLEMTAAKDINLQSRAGGIELSALNDVKLSALDGSIRLESAKILMPNLRTAQPPIPGAGQSREHMHRVFQLCACSNGKLFLASPHTICAGDDTTVCR